MQKTDSDYIVTPPVNKRWKSIIRNHQTNQLPAPWLTLTTELKTVLALKTPKAAAQLLKQDVQNTVYLELKGIKKS